MLVKVSTSGHSAGHTQPLGTLALWLLAVGFLGLTLMTDGMLVLGAVPAIRAQSFPSVPGEIIHSELLMDGDGKPQSAREQVRFRYKVVGNELIGERVRFHGTRAGGAAANIVATYPVGRKVWVYYDPDNPANAAIDRAFAGTFLYGALCLLPFNLVSLALLRSAILRTAGWRALPLRQEGNQWHVLPTNGQPVVVAMLILGVLALAATFALQAADLSDDGMALVVTWTLLVLVTGIAYQHTRSLVRGESASLILDEDSATVTWPASATGSGLSVPRACVNGVEIDAEPLDKSSMAFQTNFSICLRFHDETTGLSGRRRVCTTHNGLEAASVADWLSDWFAIKV
jgi:hypothetical protein